MKEKNGPKEEETRKGMTHQQRWRRNVDGTYRYIGVCPFNRAVCKLGNAFTQMKAWQVEG